MASQQRENRGSASESKWWVSSNPRNKHPDEGLKGMVLQSPGADGGEPEKDREAEPWPQARREGHLGDRNIDSTGNFSFCWQ